MNRKTLAAALAATLIAGGAAALTPAFGNPGGGPGCEYSHHGFGHHGKPGAHFDRMAKRLKLSDAQSKAVKGIMEHARSQTETLRQSMRSDRAALRKLVDSGNPDPKAVRELADRQGRTMADMIVIHTQTRADIRNVLTPEQRTEMDQWRARHDRRGGPRPDAGTPPGGAPDGTPAP